MLARALGHHGSVEINRCNGRKTVLHGHGEPENFDLRGGLLTWDTGHPGADYNGEFEGLDTKHGELTAYEIVSGRRRRWVLPRLALAEEHPTVGVLGYSTHTLHNVFWIAARTLGGGLLRETVTTSSVYVAPLQ